MALVNQPVSVYFFSYVPEKIRGTVPGVAHGGELSFVFNFQSGSEADRRMAEQVSAFWVQFAKDRKSESARQDGMAELHGKFGSDSGAWRRDRGPHAFPQGAVGLR
jgi:carboxylesterase type B